MPVDSVLKYLKDTELAFGGLSTGYIERYEEEILTPERVNLRIRVRFSNGQMLERNEAIIVENGYLEHLGYRYHFQGRDNDLIFRYDNTPHFPGLETFPNHRHLPDKVLAANRPSVLEVLEEVNRLLAPPRQNAKFQDLTPMNSERRDRSGDYPIFTWKMKRTELIKHIKKYDAVFIREGGRHTIYQRGEYKT